MSKPFYEKFGLGGGIKCTGTEVMPPLTYNKNFKKSNRYPWHVNVVFHAFLTAQKNPQNIFDSNSYRTIKSAPMVI